MKRISMRAERRRGWHYAKPRRSRKTPVRCGIGVCAECRDYVALSRAVVAKDGALFHPECWNNC